MQEVRTSECSSSLPSLLLPSSPPLVCDPTRIRMPLLCGDGGDGKSSLNTFTQFIKGPHPVILSDWGIIRIINIQRDFSGKTKTAKTTVANKKKSNYKKKS